MRTIGHLHTGPPDTSVRLRNFTVTIINNDLVGNDGHLFGAGVAGHLGRHKTG